MVPALFARRDDGEVDKIIGPFERRFDERFVIFHEPLFGPAELRGDIQDLLVHRQEACHGRNFSRIEDTLFFTDGSLISMERLFCRGRILIIDVNSIFFSLGFPG